MTDYRIVCVEKQHGHIVAVGTGTEPQKADKRLTVAQVRAALKSGDTFHTVSPTTGKKAYVETFDTIRTKPDNVKDSPTRPRQHRPKSRLRTSRRR